MEEEEVVFWMELEKRSKGLRESYPCLRAHPVQ